MAYQNVGTPRFYIDYLTYWHSMGYIQNILVVDHHGASLGGDKFFIGLDPASPTILNISDEEGNTDQIAVGINFPYQQYLPIRVLDSINYMGVLGHDLQGFGMSARGFHRDSEDAVLGAHDETARINNTNIVNAEAPNNETEIINAEYTGLGSSSAQQFNAFNDNGFSMFKVDGYESGALEGIDRLVFLFRKYGLVGEGVNQTFDNIHNDANPLTGSWNINSITLGHFYDMPVSADLKLNMEVEFDGYDQIDTTGGSTLTNIRYTGSPQWGDNNPWEIGDSNPIYKRNGRRNWTLKFSYIADKDLFASNYSSNNWLSNSTDNSDYSSNNDLTEIDGNEFEYTLMDDDSFIAKVLNFVGNGQRFIFQADNTNNNPDQFAICVLDQDSLKISQVAFKTYNISLKIREVW